MKFIATISDRTQNKENISKLLSYGIDTFRYVYRKNAYDCKILEEKISIPRNLDSRARILIDLPGYKGRTGLFSHIKRREDNPIIDKDQILTFKGSDCTNNHNEYVPIDIKELSMYIPNDKILLMNDGELAFQVLEFIDGNTIRAKALNSGEIRSNMGVILDSSKMSLDMLVSSNEKLLDEIAYLKPDILAFSFVDNREYLELFKTSISKLNIKDWNPLFYSKIESQSGVDNIDSISLISDAIIIARGDLPCYSNYAEMGLNQKRITQVSRKNGTDVYLATQILESPKRQYIPYRPEIADLTNYFLDGGNGIMFGVETTQFFDASRPVKIVNDIFSSVQKYIEIKNF